MRALKTHRDFQDNFPIRLFDLLVDPLQTAVSSNLKVLLLNLLPVAPGLTLGLCFLSFRSIPIHSINH